MQHIAAFHLGLHCLSKYLFRGSVYKALSNLLDVSASFVFSVSVSLLFTNGDNVQFVDSYPYEMTDGSIRVIFTIKYDVFNQLCAAGTAKRRKRAVMLTSSELLMTQALLLKIIQLQ